MWFFGTKPKDSTVTLLPSGKSVHVAKNTTLLSAALEDGHDWPHNCKFGSCGECKCKLVKGKIKPMVDFSEHSLKRSLLMTTFLCQSRLTMDCEVEVELGDLVRVPASTHNTKVKSTSMLTSDIMALTIETDGDVPGGKERPGLQVCGQNYLFLGLTDQDHIHLPLHLKMKIKMNLLSL